MKKRTFFTVVLLLILAMVLGACGPADETEAPADPTAVPPTDVPAMDLDGVEVTFWHVWGDGSPNEGMLAIVDEFNATNEYGITVVPLDQGGHSDVENAMNAGITSGDLPNVTTGYTNALANWYGVDVMVDINDYINDPMYGLSDAERTALYQGALDGGVIATGEMVGYPISQSANVLFYNNSFAQDLGFDSAPATSAEFKEQACAAAAFNDASGDPDLAGTGGLVMYASASNFMSFLFAFDGGILNDAGDGYDFSGQEVMDTILFMKDLVDSGCTLTTESYPNPEFASRKALFTMSSTAGVPYQVSAFEDIGSADEWGFAAFAGPDGKLAVDAFGQYVGIVRSTPEQQMATWLFIKYLTSAESQAAWIEASAYHPTQSSTIAFLGDYSAANPIWATGLELAAVGETEPNLASWSTVRREIGSSVYAALAAADEAEIAQILADLQTVADELVEETQ